VKEAAKRGLDGLKGHRSAGGMRASVYNACPSASVEALVAFMKEFEQANRAAATRS
jgi:phosphoserine aminotransferase